MALSFYFFFFEDGMIYGHYCVFLIRYARLLDPDQRM